MARRNLAWSPDDELIYEGFNEDFGPLNLACTVRFCRRVEELRTKARQGGGSKAVYIYTDKAGNIMAMVATHVDDIIYALEHIVDWILNKIRKHLKLGKEVITSFLFLWT